MMATTLELFNLPANWNDVAGFYLEAVADVPADLLALALKRVRMEVKWFPKIPEIRAAIDAELSERKTAAFRLRLAMRAAEREAANKPISRRWEDMTPEERTALEERMENLKRTLATAAGPKLMPRETGDGYVSRKAVGPIATRPLPDESDPAVQEQLRKMNETQS